MSLSVLLFNFREQDWVRSLLKVSNVYIVGGVVRDNLLGKTSKDIDIIVEGLDTKEIKSILHPFGKINEVGESFKVLKFKPFGWKGEAFDIATPRKDIKVGSGHKGIQVVKANSILEDLRRRDFTINSMAIDVSIDPYENELGGLIDPFNGLEDIKNKILLATDANAFIEDPLRIVRGIQFAARFDFQIAPSTLEMMKEHVHLVKEISGERILDEFNKILNKGGNTQLALHLIHVIGLDIVLFNKPLRPVMYFGKKIDVDADALSFYYTLAKSCGTDPSDFYMNFLNGNVKMGLALTKLDQLMFLDDSTPEEYVRFLVFENVQRAPMIEFAVVLPNRIVQILDMMNTGELPKSVQDIKISGNEIKEIFPDITGPKIGQAIDFMRKQALISEYDWTSKKATLKFAKEKIV